MNQHTNDLACQITVVTEIARLELRIRARLSGRVRNLHVLGRDNGLVLRGHSRTYYDKQLAQHAAMEMTALPIVANEIEVA